MKYQVTIDAKTCYLYTWKGHRCYGYIINRAFVRVVIYKKIYIEVAWFCISFDSCYPARFIQYNQSGRTKENEPREK